MVADTWCSNLCPGASHLSHVLVRVKQVKAEVCRYGADVICLQECDSFNEILASLQEDSANQVCFSCREREGIFCGPDKRGPTAVSGERVLKLARIYWRLDKHLMVLCFHIHLILLSGVGTAVVPLEGKSREKNIGGTQFVDWSTHLRGNLKNGICRTVGGSISLNLRSPV